MSDSERFVRFSLGGMLFEYDEVKNQMNIEKHGISFRNAARVFFDYDRIEMTMSIARTKTDTIPSEILPLET